MEIWHVCGGRRLAGESGVQGSKNAALPMLSAALLSTAPVTLRKVPQLRDTDTALAILEQLGCRTERRGSTVCIDASGPLGCEIPRELMERMRSSVIFMGALLARCGEARLTLPGGCRLGKRPIDLHLAGLRRLGAEITEEGDALLCRAARLRGTRIALPFPSVGATENLMLAACGAEGETELRGVAREPEIGALQALLRAMGCDVRGAGTGRLFIGGAAPGRSACVCVPPDRIAAATLCCAAAATGGDVGLQGFDPREISALLHFLNRAGCDIITNRRSLRIRAPRRLHGLGDLATAPYPGFPTDAQPLLMAALLRSAGETRITETLFENRFRQAPELRRLGADIEVKGRVATIRGVERLRGAPMTVCDLRAGASMVLAALSAEGESPIGDTGHIRRGYEALDQSLRALGAEIWIEN